MKNKYTIIYTEACTIKVYQVEAEAELWDFIGKFSVYRIQENPDDNQIDMILNGSKIMYKNPGIAYGDKQ